MDRVQAERELKNEEKVWNDGMMLRTRADFLISERLARREAERRCEVNVSLMAEMEVTLAAERRRWQRLQVERDRVLTELAELKAERDTLKKAVEERDADLLCQSLRHAGERSAAKYRAASEYRRGAFEMWEMLKRSWEKSKYKDLGSFIDVLDVPPPEAQQEGK